MAGASILGHDGHRGRMDDVGSSCGGWCTQVMYGCRACQRWYPGTHPPRYPTNRPPPVVPPSTNRPAPVVRTPVFGTNLPLTRMYQTGHCPNGPRTDRHRPDTPHVSGTELHGMAKVRRCTTVANSVRPVCSRWDCLLPAVITHGLGHTWPDRPVLYGMSQCTTGSSRCTTGSSPSYIWGITHGLTSNGQN